MDLKFKYKLEFNFEYIPYLTSVTQVPSNQKKNISHIEISRFIENWFESIKGPEFHEKSYSIPAIIKAFGVQTVNVNYGEFCVGAWDVSGAIITLDTNDQGAVCGIEFTAKEVA